MEEYDWSQFRVHMYYEAPVSDVFRYFSTARGLAAFFIAKATHEAPEGEPRGPDESVRAGDAYHWSYLHDFSHGGTFQAVEPDQRVQFTFGEMVVDIRFRWTGKMTEVALHQTGCATVDPARAWQHLNCRSCWVYFLTNLRSVVAGGPDLRHHENPGLNDSVSIGWQPRP